jgi:hypothetical protein
MEVIERCCTCILRMHTKNTSIATDTHLAEGMLVNFENRISLIDQVGISKLAVRSVNYCVYL